MYHGRAPGPYSRAMKTTTLLVALACALAGCQQYVSAPGVPTARGIPESPNQPAAADVMIACVQYVANNYPPGSLRYDAASAHEQADVKVPYECVVNLPRGLRKSYYERIAAGVGPKCQPMTPDALTGHLPTFHVTRVWMRFNTATVDLLRPMPELGADASGKPIYQVVTLRLEGGTEPWRVVHARAYPHEDATVPPPYFLPDIERTDQFAWQKEQDAGTGSEP